MYGYKFCLGGCAPFYELQVNVLNVEDRPGEMGPRRDFVGSPSVNFWDSIVLFSVCVCVRVGIARGAVSNM